MDTQVMPERQNQSYTYDGIIPKLGPAKQGDKYPSLLPKIGGQPGFEYLIAPVGRQRNWEGDGWTPVQDIHNYTILGDDGGVDCTLLVKGEIIRGVDPNASRRKLSLDKEICRITGLYAETGTMKPPRDPVEIAEPGEPTEDEVAAAMALLARVKKANPEIESESVKEVSTEPNPTQKALKGFETKETADAQAVNYQSSVKPGNTPDQGPNVKTKRN